MSRLQVAWWLVFVAGCWHAERQDSAMNRPVAAASSRPRAPMPSVEIVGDQEWQACQRSEHPVLEGGLECDGQALEGGVPLRYRHLPAVARDGSVIAVIEERDGWGHVPAGIRLIDRTGRTVQWLPLGGNADAARASVNAANAELAQREWVPLAMPAATRRELADDLVETTLSFDGVTATYRRRSDGNGWLPPSWIRVSRTAGQVLAERTDTERAWLAPPACNMPAFELVGASASPGVLLFATRLGMGGHDCDGVVQPPAWHVLTFK